jgi:hypothetical protein
MIGLQNISQLYQKYFDTPGKVPAANTMADQEDYTNANISTMEIEQRDELSASDPLSNLQPNRYTVDPSARLEEVLTSASAGQSPLHAPVPPLPPTNFNRRLQALIRSNRYPPGQRVMLAAIDALRPELDYQDAVAGLNLALALLHETLENAVEAPTTIQQDLHVRRKLMTEYHGLPGKEQVDGVNMDALIEKIKDRVGSRWRVEAMEKQ